MKKRSFIASAVICVCVLALLPRCQSTIIKGHGYKTPESYNLKFIGYDSHIKNPSQDRRSFFKLVIDKDIEGRTTTGLLSQKKTYTTKLSVNKHVISVKKYILDRNSKTYKRVNNINQPKPAYTYFSIPEDRIVVIELSIGKNNKADYKVYFEKD